MVLTPGRRNRGVEWTLTGVAVTCAITGLLVVVEGPPPLRLVVGSSLLAAAIALGLIVVRARNVFVWHVEEGVLLGEWTASGQRITMPLEGPVCFEHRKVEDPEHDLSWSVDVALVDSHRAGRVHLWESLPGQTATGRERWDGLVLRPFTSPGDEHIQDEDGMWRLTSGWTGLDRGAMVAGMAVLVGPMAFIASQPGTLGLGSASFAVMTLVLAYALLRTFAVIEVRHRPGLVAYRRCVAGVPLSEWRGFREPVLLDLTRYPHIEWRLTSGESMLVVRGGPRGVTPADALRLTTAIRQALGSTSP